MRVPESLIPLVDQGIITEVIRPLMSGKEAEVYLVRSEGEIRVAKIYKAPERRSFKHRAAYTEGRKVRNSRTQRAVDKRSRFGREMEEQAWRAAEVQAIERLHAAGVRVPEPYAFVDGVLVMELITGPDGGPAPRLADLNPTRREARSLFFTLLQETQKMLCAGLVHGDLSDFNVLIAADGPVIIDLPQAVDTAQNAHAGKLLIRDIDNLTSFLGRYDSKLRRTRYGQEMWELYERGDLTPSTKLTGKVARRGDSADIDAILAEIQASERAEVARREALGLPPPRRARAPKVSASPPPKPLDGARPTKSKGERRRKRRGEPTPPQPPSPALDPTFDDLDALLIEDDDA
ncbi:MAG: hypothetical protein EA397_14350 [Deltaproteobacteria bacterium]|nr:MAG: hypothetical protein EA397_14350 [Deltaproteobacteria bacterium]